MTYNPDDFSEVVGSEIIKNKTNIMDNGLGNLSWTNVKSALVYGIVAGLVAVGIYALQVGDLFALSWHTIANGFVFGLITSLLKNMATTNSGNFLGTVKTVE